MRKVQQKYRKKITSVENINRRECKKYYLKTGSFEAAL
jgi:hypothetical protein